MAAHPRFIALGTNAGLVYWYDRKEDVLHRLWCADRKAAVTRLALVESVELMLAVGNREGCITIFQIQRFVITSVQCFPDTATIIDKTIAFTLQCLSDNRTAFGIPELIFICILNENHQVT